MPVEDGIGYGPVTPLKIEYLAKIIDMHLHITQAVLDKHSYWSQTYRYIDLTAGQGISPDKNIPGSPLVFLEKAESSNFKKDYRADFIEEREKNLLKLKDNVSAFCRRNGFSCQNINYHLGSYEQLLPGLLGKENNKELGLIFVDPSGNAPDFDLLKKASHARPRMEILIYLSTTNIKRDYQNTEKLLSDYIKDMGKKYWLIRKPIPWDKYKWTFLLGSSAPIFKQYKSIDFYQLDSEKAQSFFPKLDLSKKQRMARLQPSLFDDDAFT